MILFYSDLHIRQERLEDCDTALKQIYDLAKKHNALVVNGGDTFNTRGIIPTDALDLLYSHYKLWAENGIGQIILAGNHDQQDKVGRVHPMRVFDFPSWVVVDEFYIHETLPIAFFNYMPKEKIQPYIEEAVAVLSKRCSDFYAVVHFGIKKAFMNDWIQDSDGVPLEWLKDFKKVFSGHYHYRQNFSNIQYIGSPIQQNFAEKNQAKGVLLWDVGENIEFIEIVGTRKHYEIVIDADDEFCFDEKLNEIDYLKVRVTGSEKLNKEAFEKFGSKNIMIERIAKEVDKNRMDLTATDVMNTKLLTEKYIEFKSGDLDKKSWGTLGQKYSLYNRVYKARNRCINPKNPDYHNYGGRIRPVEFRFDSVGDAVVWIKNNLGPCPEGMTLDRFPNNDGHYEPGNLRWATRKQQIENQRERKKRVNSNSQYKGVCWHKRDKKWMAYIYMNGKNKHLGGFNSEDEANEAIRGVKQ